MAPKQAAGVQAAAPLRRLLVSKGRNSSFGSDWGEMCQLREAIGQRKRKHCRLFPGNIVDCALNLRYEWAFHLFATWNSIGPLVLKLKVFLALSLFFIKGPAVQPQSGLQLFILLPQLPKFCDHMPVPPYPAKCRFSTA